MGGLTFGSLFTGIGGLDLGLERAGMQCRWQSEIDPYASRVLKKHWPDTPNLGDINDIDWRTLPTVDLICGGYPCQPFSIAGARKGTNDPRHLWPRFADAIRILRPKFALLENVTGHLSLGFGDVQADLAALGYNTQWDCVPAAAVGAPHLRDRVFIIASRAHVGDTYNAGSRTPQHDNHQNRPSGDKIEQWPKPFNWASRSGEIVADTNGFSMGSNGSKEIATETGGRWPDNRSRETADVGWQWWQVEPRVGRVANGVPNRVDRLRALGNAVVPQVAEYVGNIIMDMATD